MMNMVEPKNYWDGIMNVTDSSEEEFANLLNLLDFPMESLEGDGLGGDMDPGHLGPIPMDALLGCPPVSKDNIRSGAADMVPSYGAPIDSKGWQSELLNKVDDGLNAPHQDFISVAEPGVMIPSPVSVLESSGSCSSDKSLSAIADHPVRARSKRARKPTVNPWLHISALAPADSSSSKISDTVKNNKRKRRLSVHLSAFQTQEQLSGQAKKTLGEHDAKETKETSSQRSAATKKCTHCEVTKTPQWREGPLGPKTLCNACGVRYRSGRLFPEYRPAASPTFVPTLHSNSHKKVVAMRKKAVQPTAATENPPVSPLPEFIPG